jgi:hypothetical protein
VVLAGFRALSSIGETKKRVVGFLPKTSRIFGEFAYITLGKKGLGGEWKREKGDGVEQMDCLQGSSGFLPSKCQEA